MLENLGKAGRDLARQRGAGGEGVGAGLPHPLGKVRRVGVGLDPEVPQHGIRLPSAKERNGILVDVGTEQGSGTPGSQGPGGKETGRNAGGILDGAGSVADGVGDMRRFDGVPGIEVRVVVAEDRCIRGCIMLMEVPGKAEESLAWAEERIGSGGVAHRFPTDRVLLVTEAQSGLGQPLQAGRVIQRRVGGTVDLAVNGKVDVTEAEGLGASSRSGGVEVLGGTQEPEEGDDDEVNGVCVEPPIHAMGGVEDRLELLDDGDVARVDTRGWGVLPAEATEESSEYGMELVLARELSGIRLTQVGEPLSHGQ